MKDSSRCTFVKQTAATGLTFTFAGLIRAHGQTGGNTTWQATTSPETTDATTTVTTYDQWGSGNTGETTTDQSGNTTYDQWGSGNSSDTTLELGSVTIQDGIPTDNYTVNQWDLWSVEPVTDYTLPCDASFPHDWVPVGYPVPPTTEGGYSIQWYQCTKCGQFHEGTP